MTARYKDGDKVRVTFDGIVERVGEQEIILRHEDTQDGWATAPRSADVELIEPADDPSKDPIGTVRRAPGVMKTVVIRTHDGDDQPWVRVTPTGGLRWRQHHKVTGWEIIGAVPGTPASDAQAKDKAERPLWTGDGSEEPPEYVTKVREAGGGGRLVVRADGGWKLTPGDDSGWEWDLCWRVDYGPYIEVRDA